MTLKAILTLVNQLKSLSKNSGEGDNIPSSFSSFDKRFLC